MIENAEVQNNILMPENVNELTIDNMIWKPLYPNNMICNGITGYYCLLLHKNKDGTISGRKYTILFQHKEIEPATGYIDQKEIERYVLFEKSYSKIKGPLEYPEPTHQWFNSKTSDKDTLNIYDVNNYGSFVYAYQTMELAKQRALTQYKMIYGYVMPHLK